MLVHHSSTGGGEEAWCPVYMGMCLCVGPLKVQELVPEATKLLIDLDVRVVLASFIPVFEKCFPKLTSKSQVHASMALKLWKKVNDYDVFTPSFKRKYWLRIVATCIFAVMLRDELTQISTGSALLSVQAHMAT
jgi:hypothetical protein